MAARRNIAKERGGAAIYILFRERRNHSLTRHTLRSSGYGTARCAHYSNIQTLFGGKDVGDHGSWRLLRVPGRDRWYGGGKAGAVAGRFGARAYRRGTFGPASGMLLLLAHGFHHTEPYLEVGGWKLHWQLRTHAYDETCDLNQQKRTSRRGDQRKREAQPPGSTRRSTTVQACTSTGRQRRSSAECELCEWPHR